MITTPEIICDLFSFLDKDQIERIQLVNQFWNNVIIHRKNILPLRQFVRLDFNPNRIDFYVTDFSNRLQTSKRSYHIIITVNGIYLNKIKEDKSSRYSQLTVDEVFKNLNDVVFYMIRIQYCDSEDRLDNILNFMKLVTTKTGSRFRGRYGQCYGGRFGSKLDEIFDNYIIVDKLDIYLRDSYRREVCVNPEIVQLPSIPKEIRLDYLEFNKNEEVLNFTCNGKLNGANRLTIDFETSDINYGNFIRQWFELYCVHQNPNSLVRKFEVKNYCYLRPGGIVLYAVKRFLNNTQLGVKYSLEEFRRSFHGVTNQYVKRRCVLHETDSYALVIEMVYGGVTDMSSINASDLDQPPDDKMKIISFCVKPL